jgi:hypothetical protein
MELYPLGGDSSLHVTPSLEVPMMVDPSAATPLLPTATQVKDVSHETPERYTESDGTGSDVHVDPASMVPIAYGVESRFDPTATH